MINHLVVFLVDRTHASKVYQVCSVATLTNSDTRQNVPRMSNPAQWSAVVLSLVVVVENRPTCIAEKITIQKKGNWFQYFNKTLIIMSYSIMLTYIIIICIKYMRDRGGISRGPKVNVLTYVYSTHELSQLISLIRSSSWLKNRGGTKSSLSSLKSNENE